MTLQFWRLLTESGAQIPNHLITIQLDYLVSESQDDPNWIPRINMNGVYTYLSYVRGDLRRLQQADRDAGAVSWKRTTRTRTMQANSERPSYCVIKSTGRLPQALWLDICDGSYWIDRFDPAWQPHLNTPGTRELGYFQDLLHCIHIVTTLCLTRITRC